MAASPSMASRVVVVLTAMQIHLYFHAKNGPEASASGPHLNRFAHSRSLYFFRDSTHLPYFATLAAASAASAPWARI